MNTITLTVSGTKIFTGIYTKKETKEFKILREDDKFIYIITEPEQVGCYGSFVLIDKDLRRSPDFMYWMNEEDYTAYVKNQKDISDRLTSIDNKLNKIKDVKILELIDNYISNVQRNFEFTNRIEAINKSN